MKNKIQILRNQGLSYNQISEKLGCSKSTISYHLSDGQKEKTKNRLKKHRSNKHPIWKKIENFQYKKQTNRITQNGKTNLQKKIYNFLNGEYMKFTIQDVLDKLGPNPTCYLTGVAINLNETKSYELDHIIPKSRGGDNSINNLGLCTMQVNRAKGDMTPDEFINLCQQVVNQATPH